MSTILRKGWCPTLNHPMESGDGWLVRIHIPSTKISSMLARAIAALSRSHGNGQIDLTSRGNLQLRGITPENYNPLIKALAALGVIQESRPPREIPSAPPALGFDPLRGTIALGLAFGRIDSRELEWLVDSTFHYADGSITLSTTRTLYLYGILSSYAQSLLIKANEMGFITETTDPRRFIDACTGAPACSSAQGDTRLLAKKIAASVPDLGTYRKTIHVSGCAKGCARSQAADALVVAHNGAYTIALNARADEAPLYIGLTTETVPKLLKELL